MIRKQMTLIQAVSCMLMLEFGNSVVVGVNTNLGQDSWIPVISGALIALPFLMMYARLLRLYPGQSLFEIMDRTLGKVAGKILGVIVVWYAIHLCSMVLRNFSEFMEISTLQQTPQLPILILILLVSIYLGRSGYRTMGKWSIVIAGAVFAFVLVTVALCLSSADFDNLLPAFAHSLPEVAQSSIDVAGFPYLDMVLFLCIGDCMGKGVGRYKVFLYSLLTASFIFLLIVLRNLLLLGPTLMGMEYFPSYVAARVVNIGNTFPKIEGLISANFILAGIMKITVCLLVASKGIGHLFNFEEARVMMAPVGMLALALASILYRSAMEMFDFFPKSWIYFLPFQVAIPMAAWIAGEIRRRKNRGALPSPRRGKTMDSPAAR